MNFLKSPTFVFFSIWLGPVIGLTCYRFYQHKKLLLNTNQKLDSEEYGKYADEVKRFRMDLAQCDTRCETESYCDIINEWYDKRV